MKECGLEFPTLNYDGAKWTKNAITSLPQSVDYISRRDIGTIRLAQNRAVYFFLIKNLKSIDPTGIL